MSENIPENSPLTDPELSDPDDHETYGEFAVDDEDQQQAEDSLVDRGVDDALDEGYSPPERSHAGDRFGNTVAEQREGETLDQRIAQEEPEPDPYLAAAQEDEHVGGEVGNVRAGRLVADDQGSGEDEQKDMVAEDVGIDGAGASAEEAAIHVIDDEEQ